jgi:hypothetical protein
MAKAGKYDGLALGALTGLLIGMPSIATTVNGWISGLLPADWTWFGEYTLVALTVLIGALIGYLIDRS